MPRRTIGPDDVGYIAFGKQASSFLVYGRLSDFRKESVYGTIQTIVFPQQTTEIGKVLSHSHRILY